MAILFDNPAVSLSEVYFPAVALCNANRMRRSLIHSLVGNSTDKGRDRRYPHNYVEYHFFGTLLVGSSGKMGDRPSRDMTP